MRRSPVKNHPFHEQTLTTLNMADSASADASPKIENLSDHCSIMTPNHNLISHFCPCHIKTPGRKHLIITPRCAHQTDPVGPWGCQRTLRPPPQPQDQAQPRTLAPPSQELPPRAWGVLVGESSKGVLQIQETMTRARGRSCASCVGSSMAAAGGTRGAICNLTP